MRKSILELVAVVAIFFAGWFVLYQVDWMTLFRVNKVAQTTEEKLGDLLEKSIENTETVISDKKVLAPLDTLLKHVCDKNNIDASEIKLWLVKKDDINAFAMPDGNLVIYNGLITSCENEAELCGVICHEIAHMEKNHVMKKLMKEIGLSVLISMTTGNNNAGAVREMARLLSSTAYDRDLEREADAFAVDMLAEAGIDAEPMANFMFRLAQKTSHMPKELFWISTHPDSEERALAILERSKLKQYDKVNVLGVAQFADWQRELNDLEP